MQIKLKRSHILIISNTLVDILAKLSRFDGKGGRRKAMAFAIFPCFIIVRDLEHPMTEQWINHEKIHIMQFIESLGLFWVCSKVEYLYFRLIKGYTHTDAYFTESIEQEAYLNQHDMSYISKRPLFNTLKFIKNKTDFEIDANHNVVIK